MLNRQTVLTLTLTAIVSGALSAPAWSAAVYRKSTGSPTTGDITGSSKTELTIKPRLKDEEKIAVNDIVRVRWDDEPPQVNLSRSHENAGRLDKALEGYQEALPDAQGDLKTDLTYLVARVKGKMALADPAQLDDAINELKSYLSANPNTFRYYPATQLLAQLAMAKKDFDAAQSAYDSLGSAPWNDYKMAAKIGSARIMLARDDIAGAQAAFDAVASAPATTPAEKARHYEAVLGKATCQVAQKQYDAAVKELDTVVKEAPADDTALQAETYLRLGDCQRLQGKTKDALLAYLHIDVLFPMEKSQHAEALFQLSKLWAAVGQPSRADEARVKLESDYANSTWTKQLASGG